MYRQLRRVLNVSSEAALSTAAEQSVGGLQS